MRSPFALLVLFLPALAGAEPDSFFQPLAFLAGNCWTGALPGGKQTDEHCFSWVYGGKFLRDRHTLHGEGSNDALGESIYYWDSSAKKLQYLYIESDGGFSRGDVSADKDSLLFPDTSLVGRTETTVYRSRWQKSSADTYEVVTEFKTQGGWVPGFKVHMQRTPEHPAKEAASARP